MDSIQVIARTFPSHLLSLQLPRYKSLKTQLVKVIEHLVMSTVPEGVTNEKGKSLNSSITTHNFTNACTHALNVHCSPYRIHMLYRDTMVPNCVPVLCYWPHQYTYTLALNRAYALFSGIWSTCFLWDTAASQCTWYSVLCCDLCSPPPFCHCRHSNVTKKWQCVSVCEWPALEQGKLPATHWVWLQRVPLDRSESVVAVYCTLYVHTCSDCVYMLC